MKLLKARWLIELYNTMKTDQGKEVIISGQKEAGVSDAIEIGLSKLPSLDPFNEVLLNEQRVDIEMHKMFPGCENHFVNNREDKEGKEDENSDWDYDHERNSFYVFE